jgi:hypothetical protein
MKPLVSGLSAVILIPAALYLILVNLALGLPATQTYLNAIQPERFAVGWKQAWSWYPLRVELRGVAADGQTATEQWQLDAARAAASLSLLPLLKGEIRVHDLDLVDIDLRLRPRPTSEQEQAAISSYFPVIRNRDPAALAEPQQDSGTLALRIDDIHVRGRHAFWVSHLRGTLPGELRGSFSLDSQAGRVGLAGGALDLILESLQIADVQHVTDQASIRGRIEVPPFVISEATGIRALTIPGLDAQIDVPVQDLHFLNLLTGDLGGIELNGKGRLRGRVNYSHGELLGGSELTVEAHELAMGLARYLFTGDGTVELRVDPEDPDQADLLVRFDAVQAALLAAQAGGAADRADARALPLFSGHGLAALLHAETRDGAPEADLGLTLTIPAMEVPDLAVYGRLLPEKWDLRIVGGTGTVKGRMQVDPDLLTLELDLDSDRAEVRSRKRDATTDLGLRLRATLSGADGTILDLAGTSLRIEDTEVAAVLPAKPGVEQGQPWQAELELNEGTLTLPMRATRAAAHRVPAVAKALAEQGFGALLATASGRLSATLTVSQLDWIAQLLNRPLSLGLIGAGEIDAEIRLVDGWPAPGTTLTMPSEQLAFGLLEHRVDGRGQASLKIEKGGKHPGLRLNVALTDAVLHRRGEAEPSIGEVRLDAEVLVTDPFADHPGAADVALRLHSARVRDMSSYNAYLPAHVPFSLVSGEASLVGDLKLGPDTAKGRAPLGRRRRPRRAGRDPIVGRSAHRPAGPRWLAVGHALRHHRLRDCPGRLSGHGSSRVSRDAGLARAIAAGGHQGVVASTDEPGHDRRDHDQGHPAFRRAAGQRARGAWVDRQSLDGRESWWTPPLGDRRG